MMRIHRSVLPLLLVSAACTHTGQHADNVGAEPRWVATWAPSQQLTETRNLPPAPGLRGSTIRQMLRVSIGGQRIRLRFSNLFGDSALVLSSVHIARPAAGGAVDVSSDRALAFNGGARVAIPAGQSVLSDPIDYDLAPLADLAVTMQITNIGVNVTGHPGSRTTSYFQTGDHLSTVTIPNAVTTDHWYVLASVETVASDGATAIAVLGNSITDGRGSGTNKNNRWTDNLARRLLANPATSRIAVLNEGLGGNAVIRGGLGPPALARLDRDVLDQLGVRWLIVLEGVNDIGASSPAGATTIADELVAAYQQIVARARGRGIRVYGATILPFGGSMYDSPEHEAARQAVNQWIRTSGAYDAVIDLDAALRDPADARRLLPSADTGDHLHPNEYGYQLIADAIDLRLFVR